MNLLTSTIPQFLFIGSWVLGVLEIIFLWTFIKSSFKIGLPIYKQVIDIGTESQDLLKMQGGYIEAEEGKFFVDTHQDIYFRTRLSFSNFFRIWTPFPFKGIAKIKENGTLEIIGRVPLGTSLFFFFFAITWILASLSLNIKGDFVMSLVVGFIGLSFWSLIVWLSYKLEKQRLDTMVAELIMHIT